MEAELELEFVLADRELLEQHVQSHNLLRDGLDIDREMADDVEAARLLLQAGRQALWALEVLQDDDALWEKLSSTERPALTTDEIAQIEEFADAGLEVLLEELGYQEPPRSTSSSMTPSLPSRWREPMSVT